MTLKPETAKELRKKMSKESRTEKTEVQRNPWHERQKRVKGGGGRVKIKEKNLNKLINNCN
jgi:hypothetical protein